MGWGLDPKPSPPSVLMYVVCENFMLSPGFVMYTFVSFLFFNDLTEEDRADCFAYCFPALMCMCSCPSSSWCHW